ncbi:sodium:solute symporter [Arcticibacter sp. MXS-1]|uniref:sodium:solute symporter n=1 Tax=Arcticibacter sp. MXS-1 TaxID=3341726 RepID=UPI0035A8A756
MSLTDWIVLLLTLTLIVIYGLYKGRNQEDAQSYLLADKKMPWYVVLLGIMATQASAITFISAPGQAYVDGMRFVQYYFGLPIAMIVICITFIPVFQRLNVYTAYEYLELRFDRRMRLTTAVLFLFSRALSTGISIYAPSIILSSILGWNIYLTTLVMGGLLIIYTCAGGAEAVAHTQKLQFLIILAGMALTAWLLVGKLPEGMGLRDALYLSGKSGKLNVITTGFDWKDKYNIWSGVIGGFFLALSYFGTDQSQVGRYITARDTRMARMGLLLNGVVKVPMQFAILLIGALLFAFYTFNPAPLYFNEVSYRALQRAQPQKTEQIQRLYQHTQEQYRQSALALGKSRPDGEGNAEALSDFQHARGVVDSLRTEVRELILSNGIGTDANDTNYIFLYFVKNTLPPGLVGLLFAIIFLASWGSVSAALNSLAASSLMDLQRLDKNETCTGKQQILYGRLHTLFWGVLGIAVAMFATRMGSLIEAVNVLGSLFYGTILGIFLVALYMKRINGTSVFLAAVVTEGAVLLIYWADVVSFLWLNVVGALLVPLISGLLFFFQRTLPDPPSQKAMKAD